MRHTKFQDLKNVSPQLHCVATEPTPTTTLVVVLPALESVKNRVKTGVCMAGGSGPYRESV